MAPKTSQKRSGTFARTLFAGAALLLSTFAVRPAHAITHHYHHHYEHGLTLGHDLETGYHRTAWHHGYHPVYDHNAYIHAGYRTTYRHRLIHYTPYLMSAAYYDDGAGYHMASPYRHHYYRHLRYAHYQHSYLQCVPYAREISHIDLSGDAFLWWAEASGRYARGNAPAEGAVLNFRAIGRMPLGHVAVVTAVEDSRTILITQANWVPGSITNDVTVQDVSQNNDWSEVQVELGDSSKWGAPYPTYGFIYNRPDTGTVIAAASSQGNEVAEAPAVTQVSDDAPDRDLQ